MVNTTYIQHRLYLKQQELWKQGFCREILPVSFNYQNFIMIDTGQLTVGDQSIVYQTNSCGCGPQPQIKGALLVDRIPWNDSAIRQAMIASANPKDQVLHDQAAITTVYLVEPARTAGQKRLVQTALQDYFGANKIIKWF